MSRWCLYRVCYPATNLMGAAFIKYLVIYCFLIEFILSHQAASLSVRPRRLALRGRSAVADRRRRASNSSRPRST